MAVARSIASPAVHAVSATLLVLTLLPGAAPAQQTALPPAGNDSATLVRQAKTAQRSFEQTRRYYLPSEPNAGGDNCDAKIGRFCYWYGIPFGGVVREPQATTGARWELLKQLNQVGTRFPGDPWVAGERVRYLAEAGDMQGAVAVAKGCRADPAWCGVLEGYAQHMAQDFAAADSAYARALRLMSEADRCDYTDLSLSLAKDFPAYKTMSCADREAFNERILWLSQPRLAVPGNDLRTEHYTRVTLTRMLEHSDNPHGLPYDVAMHDLIVRYGIPYWWTRWETPFATDERPAVVGHEPAPAYWYFPLPPDNEKAKDPLATPAWDLDRLKPAARYGPAYAASVGTLRHIQIARFRRPDGIITVAGFDVNPDTGLAGRKPLVDLAVSRDPATPNVATIGTDRAATGRITVKSPWNPVLFGVEAHMPDGGRAARARAIALDSLSRTGFGISDLLLVEPGEDLPETLEEASQRALFSPFVARRKEVGVFWEVYSPPDTLGAQVEVRVVQLKLQGMPAILGRSVCAPSGKTPVSVRFQDKPGARPNPGRALTLDFSRLDRGRYAVGIRIASAGGAVACTSREIDIY